MTSIRYTIKATDPAAHLFTVSCEFEAQAAASPDGTILSLPAWIPGSYMIREFSRHIVEIAGTCDDGGRRRNLKLSKRDKDSWHVPATSGTVKVSYKVYAWDLSVRCAHLDPTHAFFNGTGVFLRVVGAESLPHIVDIERPDGSAYSRWRVATSLRTLKAKPLRFGTYQADNYDELVDHPVELGNFLHGRFDACGTTHEVAVTGHVPNLDMERLCRDLQQICEAQIRFFEPQSGKAPFDRYVFLVMAVGEGYGGLEHRASTALICKRDSLPTKSRTDDAVLAEPYAEFLGLASHEYFHSWNVKRIKPAVYAPYDFNREVYSSLLWIFEGFTSYYDDLFLVRCGLIDEARYLKRVASTIGAVLRGNGRTRQSVAESSFDAWIKYYRQDENAPNAIVSYYAKGSLVALALDLHIRKATNGKKALDDVMRALWRRFGHDFYPDNANGLGEDEFPGIVLQATGVDVSAQVQAWAYGTRDLPLTEIFESVGIQVEQAPESNLPVMGIKMATGETRLAHVYDGGPARSAGLSAGDTLVAIDDIRVTAGNLDTLLGRYAVGARVQVHAFRRDELFVASLKLGQAPKLKVTLTPAAGKANPARRAWLFRTHKK